LVLNQSLGIVSKRVKFFTASGDTALVILFGMKVFEAGHRAERFFTLLLVIDFLSNAVF